MQTRCRFFLLILILENAEAKKMPLSTIFPRYWFRKPRVNAIFDFNILIVFNPHYGMSTNLFFSITNSFLNLCQLIPQKVVSYHNRCHRFNNGNSTR